MILYIYRKFHFLNYKKFMPLIFIIILINLTSCNSQNSAEEKASQKEIISLEQGRRFTKWFYSNKFEEFKDQISNSLIKDLSIDNMKKFREIVAQKLGKEINILNERIFIEKNMYYVYQRFSTFEKFNRPAEFKWIYGENGVIYSYSLETLPAEAHTEFLNYQTKTNLRLPFNEEWYVADGGRTINYNKHADCIDQRFAYDFIILKNRTSHVYDGSKNEYYYCFGKQILAPGDGIVVELNNTVHDNNPKELNKKQPKGNYVIIDHGNGEYSFLAHLMKGSIVVENGDSLKSGQLIGLCGNSGNSSESHLHYHLQDTPIFWKGQGLPAQFQSYVADSVEICRGEPIWNQFIKMSDNGI